MFDRALANLDGHHFLGIEHKLLNADFTPIFGNPAVAKLMRIIVSFISVLVGTVKTLIILAIVPLSMSCEVTFIEECFVTVWVNTKEAEIGSM